MKILHVTNLYPMPDRPSFGIYVKVLLESLAEIGVDNTVLLISGFNSKLNYLSGNLLVREKLRKETYDAIHVHCGLTLLSMLTPATIPAVVSYYGSDLMNPVQRLISNGLASRARMHVVQSRRMTQFCSQPNPEIIPTGIDLDTFFPIEQGIARQTLGIDHSKPIALFVAHPQNPVKQFHLAEQAVQRARITVPDLELMAVYGKSHDEVNLYLNAADMLLLTSKWEGSPNVIKEALACNLPVIAHDVGDVSERLEQVRYSIATADPDVFARQVAECATGRQRTNGREVVSPLSLPVLASRWKNIYETLVHLGTR